jgi:Sec-independent protein translocase protein TatA
VFDFSPIKILLIIVVSMVLLGPDKLPEVAQRTGKAWRSLRSLQGKMEAELRDAIPTLPDSGELVRYARSPIILLNDLASRANAAEQAPSETEPDAPVEPLPRPATFHKPIVNPVTQWQQPAGPFDPTLN